jgi:hypothetical protein
MGIEKRKVGRQWVFESPDELLDYFEDYLDECRESKELPNEEGFRSSKAINKATYAKYKTRPEYHWVFDYIYDTMTNGAIQTKLVDIPTKLRVLSRFGYTERQTVENVNKHEFNTEIPDDVLIQALKEILGREPSDEEIERAKKG